MSVKGWIARELLFLIGWIVLVGLAVAFVPSNAGSLGLLAIFSYPLLVLIRLGIWSVRTLRDSA